MMKATNIAERLGHQVRGRVAVTASTAAFLAREAKRRGVDLQHLLRRILEEWAARKRTKAAGRAGGGRCPT